MAVKRRRFTFSLRLLLVATSVFAVYFAVTVNRWRRNQAAVDALQSRHASFSISYDGPSWLRHAVGSDEYFYNLGRITLGVESGEYDYEHPLTDKEFVELLPHLSAFSKFHILSLFGTEITDESLVHVATLHSLDSLDLGGTRVTDSGAAHLVSLTNLTDLNLSGTALTPRGFELLRNKLPNCRIVGAP